MAIRHVHNDSNFSNMQNAIDIVVSFPTNGAGQPTPDFGDISLGGKVWCVITRPGGTGNYLVTTIEPYPDIAWTGITIGLGAPAGQWNGCPGTKSQNADGTWALPFTLFNAAAAADLAAAAGNRITLSFTARLGTLNP